MQTEPLVSIGVLTYNSAKTVVETLESIKAQTYKNIELVISDDCSQDDTVAICEEWVARNKERFVRTEILTVDKNTGISANGNRMRQAFRGVWKKCIAGDDALLPAFVEDNMAFVKGNPDALVIFSRVQCFGDTNRVSIVEKGFHYGFFFLTPREQYLRLLLGSNFPTPSIFSSMRITDIIGGNDESIPLVDDLPNWLKMTKAGIKMHFFNKETVRYRVGNSISLSKTPSPLWLKSQELLNAYIDGLVSQENRVYRQYFKGVKRLKKGGVVARLRHFLNPYTWYMFYLLKKMERYDRKLNKEFQKNKS